MGYVERVSMPVKSFPGRRKFPADPVISQARQESEQVLQITRKIGARAAEAEVFYLLAELDRLDGQNRYAQHPKD